MKKILIASFFIVAIVQSAFAGSVTVDIPDTPSGGTEFGSPYSQVTYTGRVINQLGQEISEGGRVKVGDVLTLVKDSYSDNTQIYYFCPAGPNPGSPYGYWNNNPTSQNGDLYVKPPVTNISVQGFSVNPYFTCWYDGESCDPYSNPECQVCGLNTDAPEYDPKSDAPGGVNCVANTCTITGAGNIKATFVMSETDFRSNYSTSARHNSCTTNVNGKVSATGFTISFFAESLAPNVEIRFSFFEKVKSFLKEMFS